MAIRLQKTERGVSKELQREAEYYAGKCQAALTRLGLDHHIAERRAPSLLARILTGKRAHQEVGFDLALGDEDRIWLRVDAESLPYLVSITKIIDVDIETNLKYACRRPVKIVDSYKSGPWIEITRDGSVAGIPKLVPIYDALKQLSDNDPPLKICLGATEGRQMIKLDLARLPHILIGGATGAGKSVLVNAILVQLLLRNSPAEMELWLVDMKDGVEFYDYRHLPHVMQFVTEPDTLEVLMYSLVAEIKRRGKLMKGKAKDIIGWNAQHKTKPEKQLSYIVLVVDELGEIMLHPNRNIRRAARETLIRILQIGRSAGVCCVLSTQTPTSDIVPPEVRHNIPARLAFNCSQSSHSAVIIGTGDAKGLSPRGRGILNFEGQMTFLQAPFVDEKKGQVKSLVKKIEERWGAPPPPPESPIPQVEILCYSMDNLGGSLARRDIFAAFQGRVTNDALQEWLASLDGKTFTRNGIKYRIEPGAGKRPRSIVTVDSDASEPDTDQLAAD